MVKSRVLFFVIAIAVMIAGFVLVSFMAMPPAAYAAADGRLNCQNASPIVIYCTRQGVDIYNTEGDLLLRVSHLTIDATGVPGENTLLASSADGNVRLFRLSTGEFQVNAYHGSEEYVAIWHGCDNARADIKNYSRLTGELLSDDDGCIFPAAIPTAQPIPTVLTPPAT